MAKTAEVENSKALTAEEIQRQIAEVQLETAQLGLEEARRKNTAFRENEKRRHTANKERQTNIGLEQRNLRNNQKSCAHLSGGEAGTSPLEGGGKFSFSVISRAIMPDGKTELLQCPRCRLKLYGRELTRAEERKLEAAAKKDPDSPEAQKWDDYLWWKELRKASKKEGIPHNEMRGPTFMFQNEQGVNFIPDMR